MGATSNITAEERRRRHEVMLREHYRGRSVKEIAAAVPCSIDHVYKTLPKLLDKETEKTAKLAERELVTQLGRLRNLYAEVYAQWEKSCQQRKETLEKTEAQFSEANGKKPAGNKGKTAKHETTIDGLGDPRYIEQLRAIQADIRRLLRLDKDENLSEVLGRMMITQINVQTNHFHPLPAPDDAAIIEHLNQFGMSLDGHALPAPAEAIEANIKDEPAPQTQDQ